MTRAPPAHHPPRWGRLVDPALFVGLLVAYLFWLLFTVEDLGYARDEGFYFHAAREYGKWFELLASEPAQALKAEAIDRYWGTNHEHPALMKSLFWASKELLHGSVFTERGTAYRFPAMLLSALSVAVTFAWGRRSLGRAGGVVAALFFAFMPRVFYHAHLSCFDLPIAALWLLTTYAYCRSLEASHARWAVLCALVYGLALNTKHNAWLLPPALVLHVIVRQWGTLGAQLRRGRLRVPLALVLMVSVGPLMLYATWPWIWHDTGKRLAQYVRFHAHHVYYNMEFLGQTYFKPPMPRGYAWLMTLGTVPLVTLCCFVVGLMVTGLAAWSRRGGERRSPDLVRTRDAAAPSLWLLCIVVSYAPWLSSGTPIFGGTKHWLTAYPFIALFAGRGFVWVVEQVRALAGGARPGFRRALPWGVAAALLCAPAVMTWHSHPYGLSAYTPLVGGAPGAATLGLNRTFWGYTTGAVQGFLNAEASDGDRVFVHDTTAESFRTLQLDRRLNKTLRPWWSVSGSKFALYHHEQHMSRVEHMIWVDYGTTRPAHVGTFDGVPVVWVYRRP